MLLRISRRTLGKIGEQGRSLTFRTRMDIHVSGKAARSWEPFFASLALMHFWFSGRRPRTAGRSSRAIYVFRKKTGTQLGLLWRTVRRGDG